MARIDYNSIYGAQLVTDLPLARGELVCHIDTCPVVDMPTYQTIQIGAGQHLEELGILAYMNHSCRPNTIVDTTALTVVACRDIDAGEGLNFFYPSTEWDMDRPFTCLCGAADCLGTVAGARYLAVEVLGRYFINRHIREMIAASLAQGAVPAAPEMPSVPAGGSYLLNGRSGGNGIGGNGIAGGGIGGGEGAWI